MFTKKNERKGGNLCLPLALGALAMVGAISITKKGKALFCTAKEKMKNCFENKCDTESKDSFCEDGFSYSSSCKGPDKG